MKLFRPILVGLVGVSVLLGNSLAYARVGNANGPTVGTTKHTHILKRKKHRKHMMMHHMKMMKKY